MTSRELPSLCEDAERGWNRVEGEVARQRAEVDVPREVGSEDETLQLRGEQEPTRCDAVVQRLDPEPIAGEDEVAPTRVPEGDREHAPQRVDESRAVLLVEVNEH